MKHSTFRETWYFKRVMNLYENTRLKATLAIVGVSLIYASVGIPVRVLSTDFTILQQLYLWLFTSTLFTYLFFKHRIRWHIYRHLKIRDTALLAFRALSFYTVGYSLYSFGITNAKYGSVAVIYAFPMLAVLGPLLLGEKLTAFKGIAVTCAVFGAILIGLKDISSILSFGLGELVTLVSVFFFGISIIARKWQTDSLNVYEMTFLMFSIATITTFLLSLALGEPLPNYISDISTFGAITTIGIMNTIALLFTNYGYKHLEAITAGTISYVDTVFGVIISILLYREIPSLKEAFGGLLIVASALFIHRLSNRQSNSKR